MNANMRFEIIAEAFRIDTGIMAPGKDVGAAGYGFSLEERHGAFDYWMQKHSRAVNAMIVAFESLAPQEAGSDG